MNASVITTIQSVTPAVRALLSRGDDVILVGDRKTPDIPNESNLTFLGLDEQLRASALARALPVDHYVRKNLGYLRAMSLGARTIFDTDDDNIPLEGRSFPPLLSDRAAGSDRWVNAYGAFTDRYVWPRGYPLRMLPEAMSPIRFVDTEQVDIAVWQSLADGDPDVDAIWRLVFGNSGELTFEAGEPFHLLAGSYCPINSQSTLWTSASYPLLYLPATVSFRHTDILRGFVAQRAIHAAGLRAGFCAATVRQERNAHDLLKDLEQEVEVYLQAELVIDVLEATPLVGDPLDDLNTCYEGLVSAGVVERHELDLVAMWADEVRSAQ